MSGIRYRRVIYDVMLNIDIVCLHTISYARPTISYVFFQGDALLSQSPWDPTPMLWAYGQNLLKSVRILEAAHRARKGRKYSFSAVPILNNWPWPLAMLEANGPMKYPLRQAPAMGMC